MAFTVEDFHDLLHLLEQHPEWRAALRQHLLPAELLELPALVRQIAEGQARLEAAVERLTEAQARSEARLAGVEERQDRLEAALNRLAEAQALTERRLEELAAAQARTDRRLDQHERRNALDFQVLKDAELTRTLAARAGVFRQFVADPHPLSPSEAEALLNQASAEGRLDVADLVEVLWADLLVRGVRDQQQGYLVVEASWTIGLKDADRAARRARLLHEKAGLPAWPLVVGYRVLEQASPRLARQDVLSLLLPERYSED